MELMQLEMLVAAVEERSIQKAAERVCRTQPAVSMALRKLEQEIGTALFDRSHRHQYLLTEAGELLYRHAKSLLSLRDQAGVELQELSQAKSGRLRVGANESISVYLLPQLVQAFHRQHPGIKVELICGHSTWLLEELHERRMDLAFLACLPERNDLEARFLMHDEVVLVFSPSHGLAGRKVVSMRDLAGESVIIEGMASSFQHRVLETFNRADAPVSACIESSTVEAIKKMVLMNVGIGMVPLMCVRDELERGDLMTLPLKELQQERSLWVVRRRTGAHSQASEAFMKLLSVTLPKPVEVQAAPIVQPSDSFGRVEFWNQPPLL